MLASQVLWGDVALQFQFYDGLPEQLKEKVTILRKPESLREMVNVTMMCCIGNAKPNED